MKLAFRSDAPFDVVGIGRNSWDRIAVVASYPPRNAKVDVSRLEEQPGGQVATTLVAASRLGAKTRYLGKFGDDRAGRRVRESLLREGIDLAHCRTAENTPNQSAFIVVDPKHRSRNVFACCDERLKLLPGDFPSEAVTAGKILYLGGRDPKGMLPFARMGKEAGCLVVVDADAVAEGTFELLPLTDVVVCPEEIPAKLVGERSVERATDVISRMGPGMVCCTRGDQGAIAYRDGAFFDVPPFDIEVLDTTGAGDVFQGALLVGLLEGWEFAKLLRFASACAALKCQTLGGQSGIPSRRDVEAFLQAQR